jgi:uncharacterized protein YlxP (DUF503 family)
MVLTSGIIHAELYDIETIKGRRRIVSSIKSRLSSRNISLLDIGPGETREADIAFAFLSHSPKESAEKIVKIEKSLHSVFPQYDFVVEYESI